MPTKSILAKLLCITKVVIKSMRYEDGCLIVSCRPRKGQCCLCPYCNRKSPIYDYSKHPQRWRALDLGTIKTYIEYTTMRIKCPEHGTVVASVPWAAHATRFTYAFEEQIGWLCVHCCRSAVATLMRVDWKSVGDICKRVYKRAEQACGNRFDGLVRIGIDETSYKKGHKYLTVVIDHDKGRVIWCAKGHGKEVLTSFFESLSEQQHASIEVVTADGARWIADVVSKFCPCAKRVMDPFHVVCWASDVLDDVRKQTWNNARLKETLAPKNHRGRPRKGEKRVSTPSASVIKNARFALLKNPENLTSYQAETLERLIREDPLIYRAYLMKERLRDVFKVKDAKDAKARLESWLASACHSGIQRIRELSKKVRRHKEAIVEAVRLGISNARVEAINNKIKLTVRMGYGFRNIDNLIALIMLRCSNLSIELPGRQ